MAKKLTFHDNTGVTSLSRSNVGPVAAHPITYQLEITLSSHWSVRVNTGLSLVRHSHISPLIGQTLNYMNYTALFLSIVQQTPGVSSLVFGEWWEMSEQPRRRPECECWEMEASMTILRSVTRGGGMWGH